MVHKFLALFSQMSRGLSSRPLTLGPCSLHSATTSIMKMKCIFQMRVRIDWHETLKLLHFFPVKRNQV